jgi:hypothetical protein
MQVEARATAYITFGFESSTISAAPGQRPGSVFPFRFLERGSFLSKGGGGGVCITGNFLMSTNHYEKWADCAILENPNLNRTNIPNENPTRKGFNSEERNQRFDKLLEIRAELKVREKSDSLPKSVQQLKVIRTN